MERSREPLQGNLFLPEDLPLPVITRKAMVPLVAALITAVMTSTCPPPAAQTGGGDDD